MKLSARRRTRSAGKCRHVTDAAVLATHGVEASGEYRIEEMARTRRPPPSAHPGGTATAGCCTAAAGGRIAACSNDTHSDRPAVVTSATRPRVQHRPRARDCCRLEQGKEIGDMIGLDVRDTRAVEATAATRAMSVDEARG